MTVKARAVPSPSILSGLLLRWEWLLVVLLGIACMVNASLSPYFLDVHNLFDMTFHFMERSLIALPMAFIIISGNIDLSVASNLGMSTIIMAASYKAGLNIWLAMLLGLAAGAVGGLINGLLVARVRLPSLVVTLGTYALYRGVAFVILGDLVVTGFPSSFTAIGQGYVGHTPIPVPLVIFAFFAVLFGLLLHRTAFGRLVYAVGNNETACRFSGVAVDRIRIILFTLSGLMSALAGVVLSARFGSARPNIALGFELDVITAVVLGGVDINGGQGTMPGVVLALFLIGVVRYGMSLKNVPGQIQNTLIGMLLIVAILLPQFLRRLASRSRA
ncbi:MAG: ABC transporter permease [Anaerolineae bacterium]|nr:ABC transporter permease [Anaerolineae bacterium]